MRVISTSSPTFLSTMRTTRLATPARSGLKTRPDTVYETFATDRSARSAPPGVRSCVEWLMRAPWVLWYRGRHCGSGRGLTNRFETRRAEPRGLAFHLVEVGSVDARLCDRVLARRGVAGQCGIGI